MPRPSANANATNGPVARFRYSPLPKPNTLRLLKLRPSRERDSPLNCELVELDPDDPNPEPYEAVSWCWGPQPKGEWAKELLIEESDRGGGRRVSVFYISDFLDDLLRGLRYNVSTGGLRTLWIDVLCINQDDDTEKSVQIPMMSKIYGKSVSVCIWLGVEDEYSKRAIDFIKKNVLMLWEFDKLCKSDGEEDMSEDWKAFIELLNREWFTRRWVVQEVSLAPRAVVHCGEQTITWQEFSDAVSLFIEAESKTHRLSEVVKASRVNSRFQDFFGHIPASGASLLVDTTNNLFRRSKDGGREPISSLEYLVCSLPVFRSSEPRDIIYALLAIAKDTQPRAQGLEVQDDGLENSAEVRRQMKAWAKVRAEGFAVQSYYVDYRQPVIDVYKDFVLFAIRKAEKPRALDIICRPWAPQTDGPDGATDDDSLPSWICTLRCAPFDVAHRPSLGMRMDRKNADPLVGLPGIGGRNYSAAGTRAITASQFRFKKTSDQKSYSMFVEGFVLDEVDMDHLPDTSTNGDIPSCWRSFMRSKGQTSPEEDFWRTLVADRGPDGKNPPAFYPRACEEVFNTGTRNGLVTTDKLIHESNCTIVAEFLRRVRAVIWNRRMMRTKELGKLGLFPAGTRRGDLICILYGCSVPVILRRVEKSEKEVIADMDLDEGDRVEAIILIQRRFRERRSRKADSKFQEHARFRALLWEAARPYVFGPTAFNLFCSIAYLSLLSWMSSMTALDIARWAYSAFVVLRLAFSCASKATLDESLDFVEFVKVICCVPAGPLVAWSWTKLVKILRPLLARWRKWRMTEPISDPTAVKPRRQYFKLIGEAYVHGMMNGEAISLQNERMSRVRRAGELGTGMNGYTQRGQEGGGGTEMEVTERQGSEKTSAAARKRKSRRSNKQKKKREEKRKEESHQETVQKYRAFTFEIR